MSRRMECKACTASSAEAAELAQARFKGWGRLRAARVANVATLAGVALLLAVLVPIPAHAQLDLLKNAVGGGNAGGGDSGGLAGGLGGLASSGSLTSLTSITSSSIGNTTGVLQFCIKNNYLGSNNLSSATDVKDKLLGKIGTQSGTAAASPGYLDGVKGLLSSPDGKTVDLNGGGVKEQLTRKVCDKVLEQARSFL